MNRLDLNIYNYTIDDMIKVLKLKNGYSINDIENNANKIINKLIELKISSKKKDMVIDFIKQIIHFLENEKYNRDKHEYLKLLVLKQNKISNEFDKITNKLNNK